MSEIKALADKRVGHQDKFKEYGINLPYKPKKTKRQEYLSKGYRLTLRNGIWYAIKGSDEIRCRD